MKKYLIRDTTKRAMGNAFKAYDRHHEEYVIILCDGGEMMLNKALDSHGWYYHNAVRINNVTADSLQRDGMKTLIIEEV